MSNLNQKNQEILNTEEDQDLAKRIRQALEEGQEIILTVLESMKIEKVVEMSDKK